jgi:hypothetical protein
MPSLDPDRDFRLETAAGIPYALMPGFPKFSQSEDGPTAEEQYMMRAEHVLAFMDESYPFDLMIGGVLMPIRRSMPGATFMVTKDVKVEPFDAQRPMDPFSVDSGAPENTYNAYARVSISYGVHKESESDGSNQDPNKPSEFLEHSFQSSGEVAIIRPEKITDEDGSGTVISVADPAHADPILKSIPSITHNLRWKYVQSPDWDVIQKALGKINSVDVQLVKDYVFLEKVVLFNGFSGSKKYLYTKNRYGVRTISQPWQLDFQFIERAVWDQIAGTGNEQWITWNMVYRAKKGWVQPNLGTAAAPRYLYKETPFKDIFVPASS